MTTSSDSKHYQPQNSAEHGKPIHKLALLGAGGRMGRLIVAGLDDEAGLNLVSAVVNRGSPLLDQGSRGENELASGVPYTDDTITAIARADIIIDVSRPELAKNHSELAAQSGAAYVTGVTGLDAHAFEALRFASAHSPVLYAANFSFGLNVVAHLLKQAGQILDGSYDCDILDTHHNQKRDAPSGTAFHLAEAVQIGRRSSGRNEGKVIHSLRQDKRHPDDINFAIRRQGGLTGEHEVTFANDDELITLGHRSLSRRLYTQGAIRAALWLVTKSPGMYSTSDWIAEALA